MEIIFKVSEIYKYKNVSCHIGNNWVKMLQNFIKVLMLKINGA
jgi:hypothetical protein